MNAGGTYPSRRLGDFQDGFVSSHGFVITPEELTTFSSVSGDHHPLHRDQAFARARGYPDVLIHGMLVASRCSAYIAHDFVGAQGLLVAMSSDFRAPAYCGEGLRFHGGVARVQAEAGTLEVAWTVTNERGVIVQRGTACVWLPAQ